MNIELSDIYITKTVLDLNVLLKLFWIWFGLDMVWQVDQEIQH